MRTRRIAWVDIFKALAVTMVVMGHASSPVTGWLYLFHVPALFLISGYTTYLDKSSLRSFVLRRLRTLILPFIGLNVFFNLLQLACTLVKVDGLFFAAPMGLGGFLRAILGVLLYANAFDLGGATWFLVVLFEGAVMAKLMHDALAWLSRGRLVREVRLGLLLALSTGLMLYGYLLYGQKVSYPDFLDLGFAATFYLVLGIVFREFQVLQRAPRLFLVPVSGAALYYYMNMRWAPMNWPTRAFDAVFLNNVLSTCAGVYLTYCVSTLLERVNGVREALTYVGARTISVFALHFLAFRVVYAALFLIGVVPLIQLKQLVPGRGNSYWAVLVVAAIVLTLAFDYVIRRSSLLRFLLLGQDPGEAPWLAAIRRGLPGDLRTCLLADPGRVSKMLLLGLVATLVVFSTMNLDNAGLVPDELLDAQNAVSILKQQRMQTQVIEYNKLTLGGLQLPIYGIKPYNGAGLSYVLALGFLVLGVGITSLKLITILLLSAAVVVLFKVLSTFLHPYLALLTTALFAFDPYYLHFMRYDHGPLRLTFLLFCIFMFFLVRTIYGHPPGELGKLAWCFVAGFGLYNHLVFILPLSAFLIALAVLPAMRRTIVPSHWKLALLIFALSLLPFWFDLPGLFQGYLRMLTDVAGGVSVGAAGGRPLASGWGVVGEAYRRLWQYVISRNQQAVLYELQAQPQVPAYGWSLWTFGALALGFVLALGRRITDRAESGSLLSRQDWAVVAGSLGMMILCLFLPVIGSLHHQVYTQIALLCIGALLVDRVVISGRTPGWGLAGWLALSVVAVTMNLASVGEYAYRIRRGGPMGLLSASVRDMEYVLGTQYRERDLVTYGFGMDIYATILFGGLRPSQIYVNASQISGNTALFFALDAQGRMLPAPQGTPLSVADFAKLKGLEVDQVTLSSAKGGYPAFGVATFKAAPPTLEQVQPVANQIQYIIDHTRVWLAQGHSAQEIDNGSVIANGLVPADMVSGKRSLQTLWAGATVGGTSEGGVYVLLSGVSREYCVELAYALPVSVSVYAGNYGQRPMDRQQAWDRCKTGNIWFVSNPE